MGTKHSRSSKKHETVHIDRKKDESNRIAGCSNIDMKTKEKAHGYTDSTTKRGTKKNSSIDISVGKENDTSFRRNRTVDTCMVRRTNKLSNAAPKINYMVVKRLQGDKKLMKIKKTLLVEKAIDKIKLHLKFPVTEDIELLWNNKILPGNYSLEDCHGINVVYLIRHQDNRTVSDLYRTSKEDMIDPFSDDSEDRVLMSCGHATTPRNLYEYCWYIINGGSIDINCPAVDSGKRCTKTWKFDEIIKKACLSPDEQSLFSVVLDDNYFKQNNEIIQCPDCGVQLETDRNRLNFLCQYTKCPSRFQNRCKKCYLPWRSLNWVKCHNSECIKSRKHLQEQLSSCARKHIIGVNGCPVIRACPNCFLLTQHDGDACKHIECCNCTEKFCFICLSMRVDGVHWPQSCVGAFYKCTIAPIQIII